MKHRLLIIPVVLLLCSWCGSAVAQSMSDRQVLEYVQESVKQGKEQKQIAAELARETDSGRAGPSWCDEGTGSPRERIV